MMTGRQLPVHGQVYVVEADAGRLVHVLRAVHQRAAFDGDTAAYGVEARVGRGQSVF